jgi:hypothetical protein
MSVPERRRANYWFVFACVLMLLTGVAHSVGHFSAPPSDPATLALTAALQAYRPPLPDIGLGQAPTQWDILQSLSLTMTVSLFWLAGVGLVVAFSDMGRRTVQRVTVVYLLANGVLVGLFAYHRMAPPLVSLGLVELVLIVAFARAPKA